MRLGQYDTEYCSLWVNKDGHAFIAVRGTEFNAKDLLSDVEIAVTGTVPGQDEIVPQIQRMLRDLSPDVMVDAGAHSPCSRGRTRPTRKSKSGSGNHSSTILLAVLFQAC